MADEPKPRRPGDLLLNRYFPDADEETRERARKAFAEYGLLLARIGTNILGNRENPPEEAPAPRTVRNPLKGILGR